MDLEGQSRTAVEVDGVQGWLSRLDILDFVEPNRDAPRSLSENSFLETKTATQ